MVDESDLESREIGHYIQFDQLEKNFPTHLHEPEFWEKLGRAVATYGYLEETLGKAIFALSATRKYEESEIESALEKWSKTLNQALYDPLSSLIDLFGKAMKDHQDTSDEGLEKLIQDLRQAAKIRNVLCHGSWRPPDSNKKSIPFFSNRKLGHFNTAIDIAFLVQTQKAVSQLSCTIINCITQLGFQFPGSGGPGKEIWSSESDA